MFWWILLIVTLTFVIYKLYKPHQYWKEKQAIHIKPWPIIGNMGSLLLGRESFAEYFIRIYNANDARYFGFYQFLQPLLMLKDIDLLKKITIKDFDHFVDHRKFISEDVEPVFGKNLFALRGQKWRDMRATLSPAFTSSKMRSMYVLISDCAEQFVNHFAKIADPSKPMVVEMKGVYTKYANDVIATCAFGIKCDSLEDENNEFYVMGKDATNLTKGLRRVKFIILITVPWIANKLKLKFFSRAACDFFRTLIKTTIKTREEQGIIRPDLIHLLMEARKGKLKYEEATKNTDAGFATVEESQVGTQTTNKPYLTDDDITAQAFLFFFAGFDTSSTLLSFLSYELALNEDVQSRLRQEVDETLEEGNGKLSYEAVLKMKYLDMVVCETLRKWPPAHAVDRVCVKPYTIEPENPNEQPVHLTVDDVIIIPIFPMHRNPEYFPDPERFDPERFSDENKDKIKPFSYLPFGIGPRNCIGSRFALLEAKALVVHLLSKFEIVVVEKTQIPLKLDKKNFNMASENGYWLGLKLRTM